MPTYTYRDNTHTICVNNNENTTNVEQHSYTKKIVSDTKQSKLSQVVFFKNT